MGTSLQVTVPERASASLQIRTCCGTSVLYSSPRSTSARSPRGAPLLCPSRASIRPAKRARGSRASKVAAEPAYVPPI